MEQLQEIYCRYTEAAAAAKKEASPLPVFSALAVVPRITPATGSFSKRYTAGAKHFLRILRMKKQ